MNKIKDIINALLVLCYIFMIGAMFIENDYFTFNDNIFLILNVVLLVNGLYYFVKANNKD